MHRAPGRRERASVKKARHVSVFQADDAHAQRGRSGIRRPTRTGGH
jgi:hypothetical protein